MSFDAEARVRQRVIQMAAAIDRVDLVELRVLFVADARIDDHGPPPSDDERPHRQGDAVALVSRRFPLPQRLGHDAEHRAAVQAEEAVADRNQLELAHRKRDRDRRLGARFRTHGSGSRADVGRGVDSTLDGRLTTVDGRLLDLHQHAVGRGRVDERDQRPFSAPARRFVDEPRASRLQVRQAAWMSSTRRVMWCRPGPRLFTNAAIGESGEVASSNSSFASPTGTKRARTRCDATSSGSSISRPSASR